MARSWSPVAPRAAPGAAALVLGIAGTAGGAGVASAHLAKAGRDAAAVVAVVVLVAGVVLLAWGAAVLARHGYGALLTDTRGHGRSGGHAMDFGWWGGRDIAAAVSFLSRQPSVRAGQIAVLGESMGGEQALL
jgi:predicted alpha/beta hydrolase